MDKKIRMSNDIEHGLVAGLLAVFEDVGAISGHQPPMVAMIAAAAIGQMLGCHDGTMPDADIAEISKAVDECIMLNYAAKRKDIEGKQAS